MITTKVKVRYFDKLRESRNVDQEKCSDEIKVNWIPKINGVVLQTF